MYNLHQITLDLSSMEMHITQAFLKLGSYQGIQKTVRKKHHNN